MSLSKDLLKCNDAKDIINFQQKYFEVNIVNAFNFYNDMGHLLQKLVFKNIDMAAHSLNKNNKIKTALHC
jgi:hypothetical protein